MLRAAYKENNTCIPLHIIQVLFSFDLYKFPSIPLKPYDLSGFYCKHRLAAFPIKSADQLFRVGESNNCFRTGIESYLQSVVRKEIDKPVLFHCKRYTRS